MQRQSLGSPVSKLHGHGGGAQDNTLISDDLNHKDDHYDGEDHKATKPHRMSLSLSLSPPPKPEKFVHVIPILTLLCFFILYLFSHSPSQSDLAQFNGFRRPSEHIAKIDDVGRFIEIQKSSDVLAIRSLRNLQELPKRYPRSRSHRKHADF